MFRKMNAPRVNLSILNVIGYNQNIWRKMT